MYTAETGTYRLHHRISQALETLTRTAIKDMTVDWKFLLQRFSTSEFRHEIYRVDTCAQFYLVKKLSWYLTAISICFFLIKNHSSLRTAAQFLFFMKEIKKINHRGTIHFKARTEILKRVTEVNYTGRG